MRERGKKQSNREREREAVIDPSWRERERELTCAKRDSANMSQDMGKRGGSMGHAERGGWGEAQSN